MTTVIPPIEPINNAFIPPYVPHFGTTPTITPFTYRDGQTYLQILEGMRVYLNQTIIPFINDGLDDFEQAFVDEVNRLILAVNDAIEWFSSNSIELQDPVMAGIVADIESQTRVLLDSLYLAPPIPDATETVKGIVELATPEEAVGGVDITKAVTPAGVSYAITERVPIASEDTRGKVELATVSEAIAGLDTLRAVTPAGVLAAISSLVSGDIPDATTEVKGKIEIATNAEALTGESTTHAVTPAALKYTIAQINNALNLKDFPDLKAAIAALPATGGTIIVPNGRFFAGVWDNLTYMNKPNVRLIGTELPRLSANADRLEHGSIIYGRFNLFADGFDIDRIGFDFGKFTVDTYYGGVDTHTANHPDGGTWDGFMFAAPQNPVPVPRVGLRIGSVVALLKDSGTVGHAILIENAKNATVENITGVGGIHAVAIKSTSSVFGTISGYAASSNTVVFKSDTYAPCGDLQVGRIIAKKDIPSIAPWFVPATTAAGVHVNAETANTSGPISIGDITIAGVQDGFVVNGGAAFFANDIQVGNLYVDGKGVTTNAIATNTGHVLRMSIANLNAKNLLQGFYWGSGLNNEGPLPQLYIGHAVFKAITDLVAHMPYYARVRIDSLEVDGANAVYQCDPTAKIYVGQEAIANVVKKWNTTGPALVNGWANYGIGNATFELILENYGVRYQGMIKVTTSTANGVWLNIPEFLRPNEVHRYPVATAIGTGLSYGQVTVGVDGAADVNNGAVSAAGSYFSVDGIFYKLPVL